MYRGQRKEPENPNRHSPRGLLIKAFRRADEHLQEQVKQLLLDDEITIPEKFSRLCELLDLQLLRGTSSNNQQKILSRMRKALFPPEIIEQFTTAVRARNAATVQSQRGKLTLKFVLGQVNDLNRSEVEKFLFSEDPALGTLVDRFRSICKLLGIDLSQYTNSIEYRAIFEFVKKLRNSLKIEGES